VLENKDQVRKEMQGGFFSAGLWIQTMEKIDAIVNPKP
jgi:hypothetical protein